MLEGADRERATEIIRIECQETMGIAPYVLAALEREFVLVRPGNPVMCYNCIFGDGIEGSECRVELSNGNGEPGPKCPAHKGEG